VELSLPARDDRKTREGTRPVGKWVDKKRGELGLPRR